MSDMRWYKIIQSSNWILEDEIDKTPDEIQEILEKCKKKGKLWRLVCRDGRTKFFNPDHIICVEEMKKKDIDRAIQRTSAEFPVASCSQASSRESQNPAPFPKEF